MEKVKRTWKLSLLLVTVLVYTMCLPAAASGLSDDNSLSSLNVHNGTVEQEFSYSKWEYDVTVEPGTEELYLDPETSDSNAQITSITGTVLVDGEATVLINTVSESGNAMTYTLHVTDSGAASESESETASETQSESETQVQTEPQTETKQPETEDNAVTLLKSQVEELKTNNDLLTKIIYGLIAFIVVLLIIIINLLLKKHDLKKELKEAENQMAYQTNEFARKEKNLSSGNYYAPSRQSAAPDPIEGTHALEEAFGASPEPGKQETSSAPIPDAEGEKEDVDVKMVEL